jgi:hypothetical protein
MVKILNNLYNAFLNLLGNKPKERFFTITNLFFISTILIASFASLFHVRGFWLITNEYFWATALAVATGFGIIGSMMAGRYTWLTYISFFIILIMELFGNIYDAFRNININSDNFIAWKQLIEPIFQMIYIMPEGEAIPNIIYMRWIACIQGSFIPLLVAIIFHMWMKITKAYKESAIEDKSIQKPNNELPDISIIKAEIRRNPTLPIINKNNWFISPLPMGLLKGLVVDSDKEDHSNERQLSNEQINSLIGNFEQNTITDTPLTETLPANLSSSFEEIDLIKNAEEIIAGDTINNIEQDNLSEILDGIPEAIEKDSPEYLKKLENEITYIQDKGKETLNFINLFKEIAKDDTEDDTETEEKKNHSR